jgi:hypothetical protein
MGSGFSIVCKNCDEYSEFLLGYGMLHSSLDAVLDLVPFGAQKQIFEIRLDHQPVDVNYGYELFECSSCKTLHSRFDIRFKYGESQKFQCNFYCGDCRKSLRRAKKDPLSYRCRNCGEPSLEHSYNMCPWD